MWKLRSSLMTLVYYRRIRNAELVLDADVALLLVLLFEAREALGDLRLADHLLRKLVEREAVPLLEIADRVVEHLRLIGLRNVELLRKMLRDVLLAHRQGIVRVVVVVLTLTHAQEVVDPVAGLGAVGVIDDVDREARLALHVEDDGPLVQPFDVDAFTGRDADPFGLVGDIEERVARLRLEEPQRVGRLAPEAAVGEVDRVEFAALDLRVLSALVEARLTECS